jgi:pyridoxal phosphate enzyme (YggS family)
MLSTIRDRYLYILDQINEATIKCGRIPEAVRLVVVSKSQPLAVICSALAAGITVFGENYADEAVEKIALLRDTAIEWHMIGHVQSRKADLVAANFAMLHSLDSLKLANRLNRYCGEIGRTLPVLMEFNVSGEESKFGLPAWDEGAWSKLRLEIEQIVDLPNLKMRGLMTMPPYYNDPEQTRPYFRRLRYLQEYLIKQFPETDWRELSMGTSVDFEVAIYEGATIVRIGQAILGPRS